MREFSTPLAVDIPKTGNLTDDVVRNAREAGNAVVFSVRSGDTWDDVTASAFYEQVVAVAKGLVAAGVQPGDRVALLSRTRYEWTLTDYAIWFAGAVTVPIYETSSADQVAWILQDSGASLAIVESAEHLAKVKPVRDENGPLRDVLAFDEDAIEELRTRGAEITDETIEARRSATTPLDLATLIYTSGTTGRPKGCMLTHGNFMFELGVAVEELELLFKKNGASTLLFLPLAHVFARIIQIGAFKARARLGHSADIKNLVEDLGAFKPGFILAVPRVFEKVYNTASQRAEADGKGKIFRRSAEVAIAYSRGLEAGRISLPVRLQHALFDKLVYTKLRNTLGGECEYAISGGAPLGERLGHFYRGIGLTILEGYGLTETTAALSVNLPDAVKVGTVGRPFQGTTVRVADDGELLFKGGQVFAGYWNNEDATREALADGWFHSGDVGEVDDEGFIKITGRKKEILVTAGGKNVAPTVLEDRLRSHPLIGQCMVVGDGQPFIAALITIDPEYFPFWAEQNQKTGSIASLVDDDVLRAAVQAAVEDANKAVSKAESIRKFTILGIDWTEEGGQLTPSLKLKRNVVMREFRDDVDALYAR